MAAGGGLSRSGVKRAGLRVMTEANAPAARARLSIPPSGGPSACHSGNVTPRAPREIAVHARSLRSAALIVRSADVAFSINVHPLSPAAGRIESAANARDADGCRPPRLPGSNDVPYRSTRAL